LVARLDKKQITVEGALLLHFGGQGHYLLAKVPPAFLAQGTYTSVEAMITSVYGSPHVSAAQTFARHFPARYVAGWYHDTFAPGDVAALFTSVKKATVELSLAPGTPLRALLPLTLVASANAAGQVTPVTLPPSTPVNLCVAVAARLAHLLLSVAIKCAPEGRQSKLRVMSTASSVDSTTLAGVKATFPSIPSPCTHIHFWRELIEVRYA
jgi:hypothetical protein